MAVFPVFLKLEGRRVLVVGAGPMAAAKLAPLVAAGARITVVAPEVVDEIAARADRIEISAGRSSRPTSTAPGMSSRRRRRK